MAKGTKYCPSCNAGVGCRTAICKCGHKFFPNKEKSTISKLPDPPNRVIKDRKKRVKKQRVKRFEKVEDWTQLQKGDVLVVKGGPYCKTTENKIPMGYKGKFRVHKVMEEGIGAYPHGRKHKEAGFCYIYMGDRKIMKSGTIMRAHRLVKVLENK